MHPIHFPEANRTYTKPKGWTDEQCGDLHTLQQFDESIGCETIISVWQPNKEDIEAFMAGRPLIIRLVGYQMCPIDMWTNNEEGGPNV